MASTTPARHEDIAWLGDDEAYALFDRRVRALLKMDADEFLRRWDGGDYASIADDPEHFAIIQLGALVPFARSNAT